MITGSKIEIPARTIEEIVKEFTYLLSRLNTSHLYLKTEPLKEVLEQVRIPEDSEKRQFDLKRFVKKQGLNLWGVEDENTIYAFHPVRLLANYITEYKPGRTVSLSRRRCEARFRNMDRIEDLFALDTAEVLGRLARSNAAIRELMNKSLEKGYNFSALAFLSKEDENYRGTSWWLRKSKERYVHTPLLAIPGIRPTITPEEKTSYTENQMTNREEEIEKINDAHDRIILDFARRYTKPQKV